MHVQSRPFAAALHIHLGQECFPTPCGQQRRLLAAPRPARRAAVVVQANLDGGLSSSTSSLLGPPGAGGMGLGGPPLVPQASSSKPAVSVEEVPLESGLGIDYTALQALLKEGQWREAEDELRAKLIEAAGPGAQQRGWVYWSEVKFIPVEDMRTLDALWAAASNGKFGYKAQREMWIQNRRQWQRFFKAIDWVQGENNVYRKWPTEFNYTAEAPKGHLPLTNALRGTRLFEAIMEHEAFQKQGGGGGDGAGAGGASGGLPSWMK